MIEFRNVSKSYRLNGSRKHIVRDLSLVFPRDENVAILGRNGAGKSTLLRMIGGVLKPDRGVICRQGRISWPMGFSGGFHPVLTGRQNARFVARIYGLDTDRLLESVEEFAELGEFLDMPYATYSSGMKARLALGVSIAVQFDCYLVDEITAVGDAIFKAKCKAALTGVLSKAQVIMVSHAPATLREFCSAALVLSAGTATYFDDIEDALDSYQRELAA